MTLRLQLFEGPLVCPICLVAVLYEEMRGVQVRTGRFHVALGKGSAGGSPPQRVVEHPWLTVRLA